VTPRSSSRLFVRLAAQNLGRRPARAFLLALTVAVGVAAVFTTLLLKRAIDASMGIAFSRMGADLLVVPRETLVNLSPALLAVEPTPYTLDARLAGHVARLPGVQIVAPQQYEAIQIDAGTHLHDADLIAFDPARDFTVMPWLKENLDRPVRPGDVLAGGRREEAVGDTLQLYGEALTVYGRLDVTSVGLFDRALFTTFDTAASLARQRAAGTDAPARDSRGFSALLVRLAVGANPDQVRFALAGMPQVKVVAGSPLTTSVRQTLTAVLGGAVVLTSLMLLAAVLMVGAVYSAVLSERRRELGLLLAIGTRRPQLVRLILAEAMLVTSLGGAAGIVLGTGFLLLCRRSLGFTFESLGVPFAWPSPAAVALHALGGVALAAGVGLLGACLPAWRVSRQEPYQLVRTEGN